MSEGSYAGHQERELHELIEAKQKFGHLIKEIEQALKSDDIKAMRSIIRKCLVVHDAHELKDALTKMKDKELRNVVEHLRASYQEPPKTEVDLTGFSITIGRAPDKQVEDAPKLRIDQNTR